MADGFGDLPARILSYLRLMDAEATTPTQAGIPAGLNDYGRHARPDLRRPSAEREWSRRVSTLLSQNGFPTSLEVKYPNQTDRGRKSCDLVIDLSSGERAWIEVKGAWRDYWKGGFIYRSYLLHPLEPGLDPKTHTVPLDLVKLSSLRLPEAAFVAELLIGFESPDDPMDEEIETLVSLSGLSEWDKAYEAWMSQTVVGQRVRCWFWHRST
jgi:hypothetical protein